MMDPARVHPLNNKPVRSSGGFVLYWMQQSQRAECNPALEFAVLRANELQLPVVVVTAVWEKEPGANARNMAFLLEGLAETAEALEKRGIGFWVACDTPAQMVLTAARKAALIVCDQGYLREQAEWRAEVSGHAPCHVVEVEGDSVVPVETASDHAEYMARTLRPKLHKLLPRFCTPLKEIPVKVQWGNRRPPAGYQHRPPLLSSLHLDRSVEPVSRFRGGTSEARTRLDAFIRNALPHYSTQSNRPEKVAVSELSPYLRFGQISPVEIALRIQRADAPADQKESFLEQLIVRRELAINLVWFTRDYDRFDCLPDWARITLRDHAPDPRSPLYSPEELAASETADPYWNAAMTEMRETGFMHNYMRMYWGKKILEWTPTPQEAFALALEMNNRFFLDGRDPNSFSGIAWIFGKHDQAWKERPVFGKVRYMNAAGLERKCDIHAYVERVGDLVARG